MPLINPPIRFLAITLAAFLPCSGFAVVSGFSSFNPNRGLTDLGRLNIGDVSSIAFAVNANGSVVVGQSTFAFSQAFRWTQTTGMVSLGTLNNGDISQSNAVNSDGSVVVGEATDGAAGNELRAFRWTQTTGMVNLLTLNNGDLSRANAVNSDGSVVVGEATDGAAFNQSRAFRWTQATNMMQNLGTLNAGTFSSARSVNADGSVVVGQANDGAVGNQPRAFRWTQATGMVSLGTLNAGNASFANSVNADGSVVVGVSLAGAVNLAFRWTQATGMVSLGTLNGGDFSFASGVNADGSVVVGTARDGAAGNISRAFRWTQATGLQTVEDWLRASGVSIPADITRGALGVNADGSVVVGQLTNLDAFIARGGSGFISFSNLNQSLFNTTTMPLTMVDSTNMVMHGAHSYPLTGLIAEGSNSNMWVLGDLAKLPAKTNGGLGEVGFSHRLMSCLQGSLGLGRTHSKQNLDFSGTSSLDGMYAIAEVMGQLPISSLFATFTALYNWGDFSITRGYINAGNFDNSFARPKTKIAALRARLDWKDAAKLRALSFSPYVEISTTEGRIDAYTEQGGGFPALFDARKPRATNTRLGVRGRFGLGCATSLLATAEGVLNLKNNNPASNGQVIGLLNFNFAPVSVQRRWLRGTLGVEQKIGKDVLSITANATTKGQDPRYWLAASYYLTF